jgi:hypothetical protein
MMLRALLRKSRELLGGAVFGKEGRRHQVDADVGALRRQDGGDQQLQRIFVLQGALSVGIELGQTRQDLLDASAQRGSRFHGLGSYQPRGTRESVLPDLTGAAESTLWTAARPMTF